MSADLEKEQSIWREYKQSHSEKIKNLLVNQYHEHAKMLAATLYKNRQIDEIEFDEFKQYAMIGLIEAIERFDYTRQVSFKSFSAHRIKGAILNGIEKYSERQEQITARKRLRNERVKRLLNEVGKTKEDPFAQLMEVAIGTAVGLMLEGSGMYQEEVDSPSDHNAYRSHELSDLVKTMERLVCTLSEQEQTVVRSHYFDQNKFEEIAHEMDLSKGRISQIHHQALKKLYEHYDELKVLIQEY